MDCPVRAFSHEPLQSQRLGDFYDIVRTLLELRIRICHCFCDWVNGDETVLPDNLFSFASLFAHHDSVPASFDSAISAAN
jgi:hypothetical protein